MNIPFPKLSKIPLLLVITLAFTIAHIPASFAESPVVSPPPSPDPSKFDFTGGDPSVRLVYLDFWASWCAPCATSFPWMEKIHKQYSSKGLKVVAVNLDDDASEREAFLKKYKPSFEIRRNDKEKEYSIAFNVQNLPVSYLLTPDGKTLSRHVGFNKRSIPKLEAELAKHIK